MSDDEDDYVAFGVALKPLEEADTIRKKPIAVEEQIVRDVNGIRRFHGAFTGGFSAGHFNTVNTPQGWYPKQFKSSRDNKSDKTHQRPEDFMDDEDVGAFGFAAQALKTKSSFQGGTEPSAPPPQTGASRSAIPLGGLLEQLVRPSNSTVGETLLMKQGWRPGSGVGPRATKASKISRLASHVKTYGCSMPTSSKESEEDHRDDAQVDPIMEKYQDFLFAPDEIPLNIANPKDNFFGIGYTGLDRPGVGVGGTVGGYSVRTSLNNSTSSKKKFSISGEAFGVGADEEDDDMEVYNRNDMGQYDFSLDIKGEERRERRNEKGSRWDNDARGQKRGIDQVDGFSPATSKSMIKKHYPSPKLPPSWRPRANPGQRQKPSRFSPAEVGVEREEKQQVRNSRWDQKGGSNGNNPSIDERRSKLFPDECNITNNAVKEEDVKNNPVELPDFLLNYQPEEYAATGGQGQVPFKPFARNEAKQLRYEQYLVCVANNRREALSILQPKSMTEWEKERERVEFERASMLFKPMKGVIGSRFVSAGESEDADKGEGGLDGGVDTEEGQARRAADMKMFGKLTRSVEEWHPAKLLCVRFNVAHPYGEYSVVGTREKPKRDTGVSNVFAMVGVEKEEEGNKSSQTKEEDEVEVKPEPGEPMINVADEPVQVKPPPDLFKAIFVDSDSDSETEEDDPSIDSNANKTTSIKAGNHLPTPVVTSAPKPWEKKEGNVLRSKEPARGIFANIDLDSLNRKHLEEPKETGFGDEQKSKAGASVNKPGGNLSVANQTVRTVLGIRNVVEDESSEEEFGPKLPPAMVQKSIVISSDSEEDVGRREGKKKKKKHRDRKKYKSKKEKRSRHYSSSDSSGERRKRKGVVEREEKSKHKKKRRYSSSSG